MKQYRELCELVLKEGSDKDDRTGVGTIGIFGHQSRYDLRNGFPILTLKKIFWNTVVTELLWFISGQTNIKYLLDNNVKIWNEWTPAFSGYGNETGNIAVMKAYEDGRYDLLELGSVYGKQWRNFNGEDQFKDLLDDISNNPFSRRHILSTWNPSEIEDMALPPCHTLWQVSLDKDKDSFYLDLQLYQRSADIMLGVPTNIASYALLMVLICSHINTQGSFKVKPRHFVHTLGDAHIYKNHIEDVEKMLKRKEFLLPTVEVIEKNIFDIEHSDITLKGYVSHPSIKSPIAI